MKRLALVIQVMRADTFDRKCVDPYIVMMMGVDGGHGSLVTKRVRILKIKEAIVFCCLFFLNIKT